MKLTDLPRHPNTYPDPNRRENIQIHPKTKKRLREFLLMKGEGTLLYANHGIGYTEFVEMALDLFEAPEAT